MASGFVDYLRFGIGWLSSGAVVTGGGSTIISPADFAGGRTPPTWPQEQERPQPQTERHDAGEISIWLPMPVVQLDAEFRPAKPKPGRPKVIEQKQPERFVLNEIRLPTTKVPSVSMHCLRGEMMEIRKPKPAPPKHAETIRLMRLSGDPDLLEFADLLEMTQRV